MIGGFLIPSSLEPPSHDREEAPQEGVQGVGAGAGAGAAEPRPLEALLRMSQVMSAKGVYERLGLPPSSLVSLKLLLRATMATH